MSYINHVEPGGAWDGFGKLESLLALWAGNPPHTELPPPDVVNLGVRYQLPNGRGRLEVSAEPALRNEDYKRVLQLTLLARGNPGSSDITDVLEWFDLAHGFVKQTFIDLTTKTMHTAWGFKNQL